LRLLLDQNISYRLIKKLEVLFPDLYHVKNLGLINSSDLEIYNFAKSNNYTIVSFDSDFIDILVVKGSPPKLIWINTRNLSTNQVASLLQYNADTINSFLISEDNILEINGS